MNWRVNGRRSGYRRLHILLRRESVAVNWKKLYRLYKEERLTGRGRLTARCSIPTFDGLDQV